MQNSKSILVFGAMIAFSASGLAGTEPAAVKATKAASWWAFQPLARVALPESASANPVDWFVAEKLTSTGLKMAPEADKLSLLRRVCLDLTGLPPSADQTQRYLADSSPLAYQHMVDELLASNHYAEQQARYWLDLVRYADSDGYKADDFRPHAWRYRDWVVQAFHEDMPYSQFMAWQLAGDELAPENPAAHIATGYLRLGIYEYNNRDAVGQRLTMLNDITDNVSDVFLGLGLQCARCHDHKFDPLLQEDYYRLQAFFTPLNPQLETPVGTPQERATYEQQHAAWQATVQPMLSEIDALLAPHRASTTQEAIGRFPPDVKAILEKPVASRSSYETQVGDLAWRQVIYDLEKLDGKVKGTEKERLVSLRNQLAAKPAPKPLNLAHTVKESGRIAPPNPIPGRGEAKSDIPPGIPTLFSAQPMEIPDQTLDSTGRRKALAEWLGKSDNFLTSRVIINRLWQQHFGKGLCANTSDFGLLSQPPSHPALLDWLSQQFVAGGWKLKPMHRLMVLSSAYRQSATPTDAEATRLKDPQNRFLSHWSVRRLTAEQIRDAALAASGELDLTVGGPPVAYNVTRRSLYLKVLRNVHDPLLEVFDAPEQINSAPERHATTTPLQSLLLANHPWMLERSAVMAQHLEGTGSENVLESASQRTWLRPLSDAERMEGHDFLTTQTQLTEAAQKTTILRELMPQRSGQAAVFTNAKDQAALIASPSVHQALQPSFSVEMIVLLRSIYPDGQVRTAISKPGATGWAFGVSGQASRRKPAMPVMVAHGKNRAGQVVEEALFSDFQIQLDRSYYLAVSYTPATATGPGQATFYLKDLANDDEPLHTASVPHQIVDIPHTTSPIVIGGRQESRQNAVWDGLIDEIRLTNGPLDPLQLAYLKSDTLPPHVVAAFTMESAQNPLAEALGRHSPLSPSTRQDVLAPHTQALADYCQSLLSSSEFLYLR